jgi:hypothetical protein
MVVAQDRQDVPAAQRIGARIRDPRRPRPSGGAPRFRQARPITTEALHMAVAPKEKIGAGPSRWMHFNPTHGVFFRCMETSGNGLQIAITGTTTEPRSMGRPQATVPVTNTSKCFVAARGLVLPSICDRRAGTATCKDIAVMTSASGSREPFSKASELVRVRLFLEGARVRCQYLSSSVCVMSAPGTQEPSWSALGWSAYWGTADYNARVLGSPEPRLLTQQRHCPAFYVAARSESRRYQDICLSRYDAVSSAAGGVAR